MWLHFGECHRVCYCNHMRRTEHREWVSYKSTYENKRPLTLGLFSESVRAGSAGWIIYLCMAGETAPCPIMNPNFGTAGPLQRQLERIKKQNPFGRFIAIYSLVCLFLVITRSIIQEGWAAALKWPICKAYLPDEKWIRKYDENEKHWRKVAREGGKKGSHKNKTKKSNPEWKPPNSPSKSRTWHNLLKS